MSGREWNVGINTARILEILAPLPLFILILLLPYVGTSNILKTYIEKNIQFSVVQVHTLHVYAYRYFAFTIVSEYCVLSFVLVSLSNCELILAIQNKSNSTMLNLPMAHGGGAFLLSVHGLQGQVSEGNSFYSSAE